MAINSSTVIGGLFSSTCTTRSTCNTKLCGRNLFNSMPQIGERTGNSATYFSEPTSMALKFTGFYLVQLNSYLYQSDVFCY